MKKEILKTIIIILAIAFSFSACVERRYYREHHQHSPEYSRRHAAGAEIDISH
jgi:hypothetical protein